jgi:ABC-2 type transport system ATP-binding protein
LAVALSPELRVYLATPEDAGQRHIAATLPPPSVTGMMTALEAHGLGKQYGRRWALSDCSLEIPTGRVTGLVGPNGAGKTTLLNLATGMLRPTTGSIEVLGGIPGSGPGQLRKVGYVAQDTPVLASLSVADHLRLGAKMNAEWDAGLAASRLGRLRLDLRQKAGKLSGGQRAQLALTMAIAKRPELLILDEPVASLDPLARAEFLQTLLESRADHDISVVLSSHLVSDLERTCDFLVVLVDSRVQVAGDVDALLAAHWLLTGPAGTGGTPPPGCRVIAASSSLGQTTLLVSAGEPIRDPAWTLTKASLEDLVLGYMRPAEGSGIDRDTLEVTR